MRAGWQERPRDGRHGRVSVGPWRLLHHTWAREGYPRAGAAEQEPCHCRKRKRYHAGQCHQFNTRATHKDLRHPEERAHVPATQHPLRRGPHRVCAQGAGSPLGQGDSAYGRRRRQRISGQLCHQLRGLCKRRNPHPGEGSRIHRTPRAIDKEASWSFTHTKLPPRSHRMPVERHSPPRSRCRYELPTEGLIRSSDVAKSAHGDARSKARRRSRLRRKQAPRVVWSDAVSSFRRPLQALQPRLQAEYRQSPEEAKSRPGIRCLLAFQCAQEPYHHGYRACHRHRKLEFEAFQDGEGRCHSRPQPTELHRCIGYDDENQFAVRKDTKGVWPSCAAAKSIWYAVYV